MAHRRLLGEVRVIASLWNAQSIAELAHMCREPFLDAPADRP
jgi:hypothetical protein